METGTMMILNLIIPILITISAFSLFYLFWYIHDKIFFLQSDNKSKDQTMKLLYEVINDLYTKNIELKAKYENPDYLMTKNGSKIKEKS